MKSAKWPGVEFTFTDTCYPLIQIHKIKTVYPYPGSVNSLSLIF